VTSLISILLPVYNAEETLKSCMESILAQSYRDFELVAVDDGSKDKSLEILRVFSEQDLRVRIYSLEENRGIVHALNFGIRQCEGEYIARMDADDIMTPLRLQIQKAYFDHYPETDLLGGRIELFKDQGELTPGQLKYRDWSNSLSECEEIYQDIFIESPVMHPTFFLRKKLYGELGGYLDHPWAEDYDFILRAYQSKKVIRKTREILLKKRDSPSRVSRNDVRCKKKAMFSAKAHYFARQDFLKNRKVIIIGSGNSGRLAFKALKDQQVLVSEFLDNVSSGEERRVLGIPAYSLKINEADSYLKVRRDCFFILCIGEETGLKQMVRCLDQNHLRQGKDYVRFV